ncbi:MAG: hypothetical protein SF029_19970 [bacterium]|nr:hypothetical protein [bacterium]
MKIERFQSFGLLALALMLAGVLAACGGGGDSGSSSESGTGGGDSSAANLGQTIESEAPDGTTITISYPDGWFAQESSGSITLSNDETLVTSGATGQFTGDQIAGQVLYLGDAAAGLAAASLPVDATPLDVLSALSANFAGAGGIQVELNEPESFTANGKEAAIMTGDGTSEEGSGSLALVLVEEGDGYVLLTFAAAQGQLAQYDDEIRAIAGTVEVIAGATDDATAEPSPAG